LESFNTNLQDLNNRARQEIPPCPYQIGRTFWQVSHF